MEEYTAIIDAEYSGVSASQQSADGDLSSFVTHLDEQINSNEGAIVYEENHVQHNEQPDELDDNNIIVAHEPVQQDDDIDDLENDVHTVDAEEKTDDEKLLTLKAEIILDKLPGEYDNKEYDDESDGGSKGRRRRRQRPNYAAQLDSDDDYSPSRDREYARSSTRKRTPRRPPARTPQSSAKKPSAPLSNRKQALLDGDLKKCRICLGKTGLTNIFKMDGNFKVSEKVMTICGNVEIYESDALPHFICKSCLESLYVALNFKALCETTDKDLRSQLPKGRNKMPRTTEFITIKCDEGSEEEIRPDDDDEDFQVSSEEVVFESATESDSSFGGGRRRGRSSSAKKRRSTQDTSASESRQRKRQATHQCLYCEKVFPTFKDLREHKKEHIDEKPFVCNICKKSFKLIGSFNIHLAKHISGTVDDENVPCAKCGKSFTNRMEHRNHMRDVHGETITTHICVKCKRAFITAIGLEKHMKDGKCPGTTTTTNSASRRKPAETPQTMGRDLFKYVAPITTTHWSDSFSD